MLSPSSHTACLVFSPPPPCPLAPIIGAGPHPDSRKADLPINAYGKRGYTMLKKRRRRRNGSGSGGFRSLVEYHPTVSSRSLLFTQGLIPSFHPGLTAFDRVVKLGVQHLSNGMYTHVIAFLLMNYSSTRHEV